MYCSEHMHWLQPQRPDVSASVREHVPTLALKKHNPLACTHENSSHGITYNSLVPLS